MRSNVWSLLILVLLAPACSPPVNVEQVKTALMEADRAWAQTTTDADKMMAYFATDATLYPQGMPMATGHDAIRQAITPMMATPGFSLTWEPSKVEVGASGDLGYTAGTYTMTANDSAGAPMTEKGKYVTVWKKQADGEWKVVADIFNADAPPPPPPAPTAEKKR